MILNTKQLPKKLLVEGEADRAFFEACCRVAGLAGLVQVGPPTDFSGKGDGRANALHILPRLLEDMNDGNVTHLAIIIDADFEQTNGLGFGRTWQKAAAIFKDAGYNVGSHPKPQPGGYVFSHPDGLPDAGLWIMPDNSSDGFLEDFVKAAIIDDEKTLFNLAGNSVQGLKSPKFRPIHRSKAELATWMAWQETPGQRLVGAVGNELISFQYGFAKHLIEWLKQVYGR
jgi:hypothetical protein